MQHGLSVVADLTGGDAEMQRAVQEVIKAFGGLDIIVNRHVKSAMLPCMLHTLFKAHACPHESPASTPLSFGGAANDMPVLQDFPDARTTGAMTFLWLRLHTCVQYRTGTNVRAAFAIAVVV